MMNCYIAKQKVDLFGRTLELAQPAQPEQIPLREISPSQPTRPVASAPPVIQNPIFNNKDNEQFVLHPLEQPGDKTTVVEKKLDKTADINPHFSIYPSVN